MRMSFKLTLALLVLTFGLADSQSEQRFGYGLIRVTSGAQVDNLTVDAADNNTVQEFCFTYNVNVFPLPTEPQKYYKLIDATNTDICDGPTPSLRANDTLFLMEGNRNCSVLQYVNYTKESHAAGFFLNLFARNITDSYGLEIFGVVGNQTLGKLKNLTNGKTEATIQVYGHQDSFFDGSILLLWVTACLCVAIGSLTGPYQDLQSTSSRQQILESTGSTSSEQKNVQVNFTVTLVLTLVLFISATLLLLYFFYDYLVYFFMAVFCFASGRASYEILNQIFGIFKMDACMPRIRGCGLHRIFIGAICVTLPVIWFVFRHKANIWILQDLLGVCFCIHIIQTVRIPNLQICTVLLSLLFVYDVFFVFITPYITSNGKSVMVEVATGGSSGESLPLLIKFPRSHGPSACLGEGSYSLLGFGDIIVPGFLVCFAHSFDIIRGDKIRPYFITTMIGYGIGLAIAFVALYISQTGQPALLYIVPSTLIPISIAGAIRKQFRDLWKGSITITEVEP